jgi:hypothetical protein
MGAKKDKHLKILNHKIKERKDKIKTWQDFGIDEKKCERLEAQQTRFEAWLEEIEAMGDY